MEKGILITKEHRLELPCVILNKIVNEGDEAIVYCQNRLVKCISISTTKVEEVDILVEWCIIPDLQEMIRDEIQGY